MNNIHVNFDIWKYFNLIFLKNIDSSEIWTMNLSMYSQILDLHMMVNFGLGIWEPDTPSPSPSLELKLPMEDADSVETTL